MESNDKVLLMKSLTNVTQAQALLKNGKKCLKPSFFSKADYLGGFTSFKKAGEIFMASERYDEAIESYEGLVVCSEKLNDLYTASEARKSLAYIYLEHKQDSEKAEQQIQQCTEFLKLQGKLDKVRWTLTEFAKRSLKAGFTILSERIFNIVIDSVLDEDNYLDGVATIWEYLDYLIENSRFKEAMELYRRHIEYTKDKVKYSSTTAKCYLCLVCIHIILGEPFIAEEELKELETTRPDLTSSPYYEIATRIINAVNEKDQDNYKKVILIPMMSQLERNLLKALKKVVIQAEVKEEEGMFT